MEKCKKSLRPGMDGKNGFTLIELTVVLAILAIIAAILVPTFLITTDRARLRGDIQTARIIQNAIELYHVERGRFPEGASVDRKIETLSDAGYLPRRTIRLQTQSAQWDFTVQHGVRVDIRGNDSDALRRAVQNLTPEERRFVIY